jgi:hypothetical protein
MRLLGMLLVSLTFVAALGPTGAGDAFAGGAVLMAQSEEDELTEEDFACLFGDECEGYLEEEFEEEEFSDEELDRMACEDALSPEECDELGIGVGSEEPACVADMESNRQQMIALALECGASCDLIGSIDAPRTGEGRSYSRYDYAEFSSECHQPLSVASQYEGFDDCARVYACAALAYTYAIDNIESYDGDCTAAAEAGLREFPVPQ